MPAALKLQVCVQQRYAPNPVCCANQGSQELKKALKGKLEKTGLAVEIADSGCLGMCGLGPNLRFEPTGKVWNRVTHEKLDEIVHFLVQHERSIN